MNRVTIALRTAPERHKVHTYTGAAPMVTLPVSAEVGLVGDDPDVLAAWGAALNTAAADLRAAL